MEEPTIWCDTGSDALSNPVNLKLLKNISELEDRVKYILITCTSNDCTQGDVTNMREKRNDGHGLLHRCGPEKVKDLLTDAHIMFVILAKIFLNKTDSPIV